jgi:hypothetical protein
MLSAERRTRVPEIVSNQGSAQVEALSAELGVARTRSGVRLTVGPGHAAASAPDAAGHDTLTKA